MLAILYLLAFMAGGLFIARSLLPRRGLIERGLIGLALGLFLMMWLPALTAAIFRFTMVGHAAAAVILLGLCALSYALGDKAQAKPFSDADRAQLRLLLMVALPMTVLGVFLQYTHTLRPVNGGYHVGQSTYGDLQLHAAITTSMVGGGFPLGNSLLVGETMSYPYLADAASASLYLLGLPLWLSMQLIGDVMLALVFSGYVILCQRLCRSKGAAALAALLFFLNGGLGFFYTLSGSVNNGAVTTVWDNLKNVMTGYYQTPTNQPDPNNLRFVNIICDMLIPQRTFLAGMTVLMPCFILLLPPLVRGERLYTRELCLLGLLAGGLPLIHTHSYLALALSSAGICVYCVCRVKKGERLEAFRPWVLYGAIAAALSVPQLIAFTFKQTAANESFVHFQFNWCNNRWQGGMIDSYFWFYIKNIGIPYLLILFTFFEKKRGVRMILSGAFTIYVVAELIVFQPNDYDNGKLFYVWLMLCLPAAADLATDIYERMRGVRARGAIAAVFLAACFLSAGLTVARECVSDYVAYTREDVAVADYVNENTEKDAVFLTGQQHLNPVSSLAGRSIVCGPGLYLVYHGYDLSQREMELRAFYFDPKGNTAVLARYGVDYILVSAYERASYAIDDEALYELFPIVYDSPSARIYKAK